MKEVNLARQLKNSINEMKDIEMNNDRFEQIKQDGKRMILGNQIESILKTYKY